MVVLEQDAKLNLDTVIVQLHSMRTVMTGRYFADFLGDQYGVSSEIPVPDDDPLDDCSRSSHGKFVYDFSCFSLILLASSYII